MGWLDDVLDPIFGADVPKPSEAEKQLGAISTAPITSPTIQGFLPPALRFGGAGTGGVGGEQLSQALGSALGQAFGGLGGAFSGLAGRAGAQLGQRLGSRLGAAGTAAGAGTGDILEAGIQGIGDLIRDPGGLSPTVADAIRQRLATVSEGIARNFRGIRAQQAGAAARGNVPVSIRTALQSALDVAQERAQRGARREALSASDQLRRQDLNQVFDILNAILQFTSSGRGQAVAGLGGAAGLAGQREAIAQQKTAGNMALVGSLLTGLPLGGGQQPPSQ